jgi:membrane protein DedA with SNARE-associated domain
MFPFDHLPALPAGPLLYLTLAGIVVASSLPIVSVVLAAEPILIAVVVLIGANHVSLAVLLVVAVAAAVTGDALTYGLGRWFAPRLLRLKLVRRQRKRIVAAHRTVQRRGMMGALLVQRWIVPTRGFVPMLLGVTKEPVAPFLASSTIAAALWAAVFVIGSQVGGMKLFIAIPVVMLVLTLARLLRRLVVSTRRQRARRNPVSNPAAAAVGGSE